MKPEKEKKTRYYSVAVNDELADKIDKDAIDQDRTSSALIRKILENHYKK